MEPKTISEHMLFSTVRLVAEDGSSGTGFYYNFTINGLDYPTIITNQHVVNSNPTARMMFSVHLKTSEGASDESLQVESKTNWIFHSTKDLCFCFVNPLFELVKSLTKQEVFYIPINDSIAATPEKLNLLSALEELVMVGYPIGLWDANNNLPIFRKGYTASHPAIDFNNDGIGLVDMACFPGSSGSPIFILNEWGFSDKSGATYSGQSRTIFLGVLFAGPEYTASGDIVVKDIPTQQIIKAQTPIMANLGYYIKANELEEFRSIIGRLHSR
jgi:hypothetical protein